jgi:hypothetical protein
MAKFFLFRRETPTVFSEEVSNTGDNLSVIAIPASHVSHMKGTAGKVTFVFNDAGVYEHHSTSTKEALRKTSIDVACPEGEEFSLIRDVLDFIANDKSIKNTMVFDAVTGNSTFRQAQLSTANSIAAKVYKQPTVMATQTISNDPADTDITSTTTTTIAGVTFPSNTTLPIVDYNETALTAYAIGAEVGQTNHWHNQGTGGTDYEMNANTGAPVHSRGRNNDLATNAVTVTASDSLHIKTDLTVEGDYTMYMVYGLSGTVQMYPIYGASGGAEGFGDDPGKKDDVMYFSYKGNSGRPAQVNLNNTDYDTKAIRLQDPKLDSLTTANKASLGARICNVWVIRRDKNYNIYVHDYTGAAVGFIPAKVGGIASLDHKTDGDLLVNRIGGSGSGTEWKGEIARFGIIESDIGSSEASRIARELFARYNYYSL